MTKRRTGWRRAVAVVSLAGALALPAAAANAQTATPVRTPTPAVSAAARAGEPMQDATMAALILGAMVVGGLTLRRFAERRG